jgi:glycosyltransferase involved in cell wall biosynthesis
VRPLDTTDMARRLTVVQMLPALEGGGVERGTLEVARELVRCGHRSIVISAGGRLVEELVAAGSEHVSWPIWRKSLLTLRFVRPLRRLLQAEGVDVLHVRSRVPAWVAWLAWRGMPPTTRPRFVTTVHGFYSVNAYSRIMMRGERVIAVSNTVRDYILDNYPAVDPTVIRVIPRGVDADEFPYGRQPQPGWLERWYAEHPQLLDKQVLTLPGRITRLKGHHDFISLIAALRGRGLKVHGLVVGGEDPHRPGYARELEARITKEGLGGDISFVGHRKDMREIYAVSDLVLSLSTSPESFGRTVLEALSLGRPVIGYAHGGVGEVLGTVYPMGRVPLGDVDALAARTQALLADPQPVPRQHPYQLATMLDATLGLYEELAGNR